MRTTRSVTVAGLALAALLAACRPPPPPPPPPPGPMTLGWQNANITAPITADPTNNLLWAYGSGNLNAVDPTNGSVVHQGAVSLAGSQHFPTPTVTQNWVLIENGNQVRAFSNPTMASSWTSPALDGIVQGRPIVVGNTVVVATENNSIYGLNLADGTKLPPSSWPTNPVSLGTPETATHIHSFSDTGGGCGNLFPLGITSHPVFDPGTGWVYAVGEVQTGTTPGGDEPLFKIIGVNPTDGTVKVGPTPIVPTGMPTHAQQQRTGLLVSGGKIYVGFGGLVGDCGTYHGWVVAANDGDGSVAGNLELTANTNRGAVWATGGGAVDGSGNVYVSSGNGGNQQATDYSDAVVRVPSPSGGLTPTTVPSDYFQPTEWRTDNNADLDLGSAAPVLAPNGTQLFIIGKQHNAFLLNLSSLGASNHETPFARLNGACSPGEVFGQNAVLASTNSAYIACSDGMRQIHLP